MPEGRGFVFRFRSTVSTRVLHFKKMWAFSNFFGRMNVRLTVCTCFTGHGLTYVYSVSLFFWDAEFRRTIFSQPWATLVGINHLSRRHVALLIPFLFSNISSLCLLSSYSLFLRSSRVMHCFHRMTNFAWTRPSASPAMSRRWFNSCQVFLSPTKEISIPEFARLQGWGFFCSSEFFGNSLEIR